MSKIKERGKRRKGTVSGAGGILTEIGDPWANSQDASREMAQVYNQALNSMSFFGQQISDACDTFKNFTETKIENMDTDDLNGDIVKSVFKFSLDVVGEIIPFGKGLTGIGKVVFSTMKAGVRSTIEAPVKGLKGEIDEKKLKKVMRDLAESGKMLKRSWTTSHPGGAAVSHSTNVLQAFKTVVTGLQRNLKAGPAGKRQLKNDERDYLERFFDSDVATNNAFLEHFYGVPKATTANRSARQLYYTLVRRFCIPYGYAAGTSQEQSLFRTGALSIRRGSKAFLSEAHIFQREAGAYWRKYH